MKFWICKSKSKSSKSKSKSKSTQTELELRKIKSLPTERGYEDTIDDSLENIIDTDNEWFEKTDAEKRAVLDDDLECYKLEGEMKNIYTPLNLILFSCVYASAIAGNVAIVALILSNLISLFVHT